ncbi:hypothetical protein JNK13_01665 [bacterium]|nr:hypothetical protein [bacterium]
MRAYLLQFVLFCLSLTLSASAVLSQDAGSGASAYQPLSSYNFPINLEDPGSDREYIESISSEIFENQINSLPETVLSAERKQILLSRLLYEGYFYLLPTERLDYLALWTGDVNEKQLIRGLEESAAGSITWLLSWLPESCNPLGGDAVVCEKDRPSESDRAESDKEELKQLLDEYMQIWGRFVHYAVTGNCMRDNYGTARTRLAIKKCWREVDLELLYNEIWSDLYEFRNYTSFTKEERKRIADIHKISAELLAQSDRQAWINIGLLEVEILSWVIPFRLGGLASAPLKAVGLAALRSSRLTPWVYGFVIWFTRAEKVMHTFSIGLLKGAQVSLSEMFYYSSVRLKSKLAKDLVQTFGSVAHKLGTDEMFLRMLKVNSNKNEATIRSELSRRVSSLLSQTRYINPKYIRKIKSPIAKQHAEYLLAERHGGIFSIETDTIMISEISRHPGKAFLHEMLHGLSPNLAAEYHRLPKIYEGATEFTTNRFWTKWGYQLPQETRAYESEVAVWNSILNAIKRGQGKGIIQDLTPADQIGMRYLFVKPMYEIDRLLTPGLKKSAKIDSPIKHIEKLLEQNNGSAWESAMDFIDELYR